MRELEEEIDPDNTVIPTVLHVDPNNIEAAWVFVYLIGYFSAISLLFTVHL